MGYYITLTDSTFGIPQENWDAAFAALEELNKHDELKLGGSSEEKWFAWMSPTFPEDARAEYKERKLPHPLVHVFQELGFDWEIGGEGDDELLLTAYDKKSGNEEDFLAAVAPFVRPGSTMEWRGEDGEMWQDTFDGTTVRSKQGRVVYD